MRKLSVVFVGVAVAGAVLLAVSAREVKAAPTGGFTIADFKGRYVAHWTGTSAGSNVPAHGVIAIVSDGTTNASGHGTLTIEDSFFVGDIQMEYIVVPGDGRIVSITAAGSGMQFVAYIRDRGRTLEFYFSNGAYGGVGTANIQ